MKSLSQDFVSAAEQVNIWVFLCCTLIAVGCMFPEAVMGASEFNVWLSLMANLSMIVLCILWLTTQTLWFLVRKHIERQGALSNA